MGDPFVMRFVPPSPEEQAVRAAEVDKARAAAQSQRAAEADARRAALTYGPPLRDLEAAVACSCGCHPRMALSTLHDGGRSCPCQATPAERREALDRFFASSALLEPTAEEREDQGRELRRLETELAVVLVFVGGGAPFVVRGVADGRAFYLRERHDHWRVVIAPDADPLRDPWSIPPEEPTICVASGDSDEFLFDGVFSELAAVSVAVRAVRRFLLRRSCSHLAAGPHPFCPECGVEITAAASWRVFTGDVAPGS
jgi:hypothetical protein